MDYLIFIMVLSVYIIMIIIIWVLLLYPENNKFTKKARLGSLLVLLIVYVGTCFVQLLTWAYVGKIFLGISIRYFIPLMAMLPVIFKINYKYDDIQKFNDYSIIFIIGFLATLILAFATKYY